MTYFSLCVLVLVYFCYFSTYYLPQIYCIGNVLFIPSDLASHYFSHSLLYHENVVLTLVI